MFCVGLSLSISNFVFGPALVVLIMIARYPLAKTIRKLEKKIKIYYLQKLEVT